MSGRIPKPITIVGGGLAGLTLGIALREKDVPVVLLESGRYPRHRVCGEFISGRGQEVLARLGLRDLVREAGARPAADALFIAGYRRGPIRRLRQPGLSLSRFALDAALADRFQALGGELQQGSRWPGECGEGVVRASGRRLQSVEQGWRWFGLKVHARNVSLDAALEMHSLADSYVGLCRLDGGEVNICGLFRRRKMGHDSATTMHQDRGIGMSSAGFNLEAASLNVEQGSASKAPEDWRTPRPEGSASKASEDWRTPRPEQGCASKAPEDWRTPRGGAAEGLWRQMLGRERDSVLWGRLAGAVFDEGSFCSVAGLGLRAQFEVESGEFRIGDALTMTPPVTGNGMSMAFEAAELALEPLVAYSTGAYSWDTAQRAMADSCHRAFASRLGWARVLHWLMFAPVVRTTLSELFLNSDLLWRLLFAKTR